MTDERFSEMAREWIHAALRGVDGPHPGEAKLIDLMQELETYQRDVESLAALLARVDREAREDCAQICDAHASIEGIAQQCAADIRATIKDA